MPPASRGLATTQEIEEKQKERELYWKVIISSHPQRYCYVSAKTTIGP